MNGNRAVHQGPSMCRGKTKGLKTRARIAQHVPELVIADRLGDRPRR
jgi:hypothetical protein